MSARKGVSTVIAEQVFGGEHPNKYVGQITVDLRAFFPPNLGHEPQVAALIRSAAEKVIAQLQESQP